VFPLNQPSPELAVWQTAMILPHPITGGVIGSLLSVTMLRKRLLYPAVKRYTGAQYPNAVRDSLPSPATLKSTIFGSQQEVSHSPHSSGGFLGIRAQKCPDACPSSLVVDCRWFQNGTAPI